MAEGQRNNFLSLWVDTHTHTQTHTHTCTHTHPRTHSRTHARGVTVSVDYLARPAAVFEELKRVVRPGGRVCVTFSNRCFPSKVISLWLDTSDEEHVEIAASYAVAWGCAMGGLVFCVARILSPMFRTPPQTSSSLPPFCRYFHFAGFESIEAWDISPPSSSRGGKRKGKGKKKKKRRLATDPAFAVHATVPLHKALSSSSSSLSSSS